MVVKESVERGVSGTSTNRPALKAMMRYLGKERGRIDYVVVHKPVSYTHLTLPTSDLV